MKLATRSTSFSSRAVGRSTTLGAVIPEIRKVVNEKIPVFLAESGDYF